MRINAPGATAATAAGPTARRSAAGTFSVSESNTGAARSAASAAAPRVVGGIDALIALQGVPGADERGERRRHAVSRGRLALDALDELKIGLLGGSLTRGTLTKLTAAAQYLKEECGDTDLDHVLGEIELRVEVELAKAGIG
jgi:Class II flagellar assembly regulator